MSEALVLFYARSHFWPPPRRFILPFPTLNKVTLQTRILPCQAKKRV